MAREQKQGLDYFSCDVTFDTGLEIVIAKLGDKSLSIIIRIWQHIYKNYGYYMPYNEDELYMIKRLCNDTSILEIEVVVEAMVEKGLFNSDLYNNEKILTSKRLQSNYKEATRRRVNSNIMKSYCLHIDDTMNEETPQRKVNNIKSNKIIQNNSKEKENLQTDLVKLFSEEFNRLLKNEEVLIIVDWINVKEYTFTEIKDALLIAIKRNILIMSYIEGIIIKEREGFKPLPKPSLEESLGVVK